MKNYQQTIEILKAFHEDSLKYWINQGADLAKYHAIQDLINLEHDPFSPSGAKLDTFAKADYIRNISL